MPRFTEQVREQERQHVRKHDKDDVRRSEQIGIEPLLPEISLLVKKCAAHTAPRFRNTAAL